MKTTYKALVYFAGVELLELGNFDTEDEAGDCLREYFIDSQTHEVDESGLSSSQIKKIDWFEYRCIFQGAKKDSPHINIDHIEETIYSTSKLNRDLIIDNLLERYVYVKISQIEDLNIKENKITYETLFEYKCHDCGTNSNVYSVKVNNELDYNLCGECLDERENEAEKENNYDEE